MASSGLAFRTALSFVPYCSVESCSLLSPHPHASTPRRLPSLSYSHNLGLPPS